MKTALFNGCSFVAGDDLAHIERDRFSQKFTDKTGYKNINIALSGCSNDRVFRTTMDYLKDIHNSDDKKYPDLIIISWTGTDRFEFINKDDASLDNPFTQVRPEHSTDSRIHHLTVHKEYLKYHYTYLHTEAYGILKLLSYMSDIQLICDLLNIPLLQYQYTEKVYEEILPTLNYIPKEGFFRKWRYDDSVFSKCRDIIQSRILNLKPYSKLGLGDFNDLRSISSSRNCHPDRMGHEEISLNVIEKFKEYHEIDFN